MTKTASLRKTARLAGLYYLIVVLTGILSLAYIPSKIVVWDNPARTWQNITGHESLFRVGIVCGIVCYIFFLLLPLALYRLLRGINESAAKLMVLFAVVSAPISFINIQHKLTVLSLIENPSYLKAFSLDQLQSQVLFYLNQFENGNLMASIFWGLWLFPFGYLVYRSGLIPRIVGVLLMLGCFGYLTNSLGEIFIKDYTAMGMSSYISLPASIGEIGSCLWLLIFGIKEHTITIKNKSHEE